MAEKKYVPLGGSEKGTAYLSGISFSRIAEESLSEMSNVSLDKNVALTEGDGITLVLSAPIVTTFSKTGKPVIDIQLMARKGVNVPPLCKEVQEEVSEQVLSFTELPSVTVNVRVTGIIG